jgi:hypothetical protein
MGKSRGGGNDRSWGGAGIGLSFSFQCEIINVQVCLEWSGMRPERIELMKLRRSLVCFTKFSLFCRFLPGLTCFANSVGVLPGLLRLKITDKLANEFKFLFCGWCWINKEVYIQWLSYYSHTLAFKILVDQIFSSNCVNYHQVSAMNPGAQGFFIVFDEFGF